MLITHPEKLKSYASQRRYWQGIPSIALSKAGKVFIAFYSGGVTEQPGNYCLLLRSADGGITFQDPIAVAHHGSNERCYDPALWLDPLGRLWFIYSTTPDFQVWAAICDDPDADVLSWHTPRPIGYDVMLNKPIVTRDGAWLFPMAVWREGIQVWEKSFRKNGLSYAFESRDEGETFQCIGGADVPNRWFDEHMFIEMRDGSLKVMVRTANGIGTASSFDGGKTWTPEEDGCIAGPCSRFHLRRLASGSILLINHYQFDGRNNLAAMLSDDEMKSWSHVLMLDERKNISYPDADVDKEGNIFITYDRERGAFYDPNKDYSNSAREILLAKITEDDIRAGRLVSPGSFLKYPVSALGHRPDKKEFFGIS